MTAHVVKETAVWRMHLGFVHGKRGDASVRLTVSEIVRHFWIKRDGIRQEETIS